MKSIHTLFVLIFLAITGCSTLPSPEQMKAETADFKIPYLPETDKAMIYVVRPAALGGLVRFNVYVDDRLPDSEMGYTRSAQYIYFNVKPGKHRLFSLAENWAEIEIDVKPNEILFIEQNPEIGFLYARNSLLKIEDYQGKYHLKSLSVGTIIKTGQTEIKP